MKKRTLWDEIKRNSFFYLLPIPGIIVLLLFSYLPMAGMYIAFEDYTYKGGLFGSNFVGLKNFEFFFRNMGNALRATRNTVIINIGSIVLGIVLNVAVACLLGEVRNQRYRKLIQSLILFPYFLSWIVVGALAEALLAKSGIINNLLVALGQNPVSWYAEPKYWWAIMIIASLWKGFGYGCIIYYATLTGIDPTLYEAAEMDGANRWKRFTGITLPLLKPTIILMFLLSIGGVLCGSLEQIMGMTKLQPLLLETTDTITTFVYRTTMTSGMFGQAAAVNLYQSIFGFIMVLTANLIARKVNPDYSLF